MNLEALKNQYAQEQGHQDWGYLSGQSAEYIDQHWIEICIRAQKAALEKAAKNLRQGIGDFNMDYQRQKMSITNEQNLIR